MRACCTSPSALSFSISCILGSSVGEATLRGATWEAKPNKMGGSAVICLELLDQLHPGKRGGLERLHHGHMPARRVLQVRRPPLDAPRAT